MKWLLLKLIALYQSRGGGEHLLSVECNFSPSCSEYSRQAIEKYGLIKGILLAYQRIRRCNNPNLDKQIPDPLE